MSDVITRLTQALEGRYEVERKLGEGGMATVYLATDVKHNRSVALKVLKPELAAVVGAERFLAEIETTANLQHPHILPLFDSGEADGFLFYVMPYVEGETLQERIDREKQLPVDDALRIATAVAGALQAAHDRGVIHRDIKPANILLGGGQPMVSDFGIALAVGAGGSSRLTETGLSVGTPFYMSPEQATGDRQVGPASDIYALAAVLYEMLTGDPPYIGSTAQAVLGKILQGEAVSATSTRKAVPANVDAAIRKALEKTPADRFARADDFARALADPAFRHGADAGVGSVQQTGRWKLLALAASVVALLMAGLAVAGRFGAPAADPQIRHQVVRISSLSISEPLGKQVALASDGGMVYVDRVAEDQPPQLFYKARDEPRGTPLADTEDVTVVVFSPDGQRIAYVRGGQLVTRPVRGGAPRILTGGVDLSLPGLDWLPDGTILFETEVNTRLARIADDASAVADTIASYGGIWWVQGIDGYETALVVVSCGACQLDIVDLVTREVLHTIPNVHRAWYVPDLEHIVYTRGDGAVFAIAYDPETNEIGEVGIPLFQGVRTGSQWADMVMGDDGTMVYVDGFSGQGSDWWPVWIDRAGNYEPVSAEFERGDIRSVVLSPDERRIALEGVESRSTVADIFVYQLPDGPLTKLTSGDADNFDPTWTADGRSLVFVRSSDSEVSALVRTRADGSTATLDTLAVSDIGEFTNPELLGDSVVVAQFRLPNSVPGLVRIDLADGRMSTLLETQFAEWRPVLSPDGRWIAYNSDRSGPDEVFVRPFPDVLAGRTQISNGAGDSPLWSRSGDELFYTREDGVLVAAALRADSVIRVESRTELFPMLDVYRSASAGSLDVDAAGERFLAIRRPDVDAGLGSEARTIMVLDWFAELREQLGLGN
jgi:serine/threonine-protein kinase